MNQVPEQVTVPFRAEVPDGWEQVDPGSVGVPGASLVLLDRRRVGDFVANITVAIGRRSGVVDIVDVADEGIGRVAAAVQRLSVVERTRIGDDAAPGVAQLMQLRTPSGQSGEEQTLVQSQVHMSIGLSSEEALLVELACTCAEHEGAAVMPDFQQFVASFHVDG